ncbi:phenylalanine--tRNA ligase subunit beta [Candidatus Peregrinibacteria bacterium]|nr:phenylalanine--tRNA ligase subunit beta [Candidatus Peregrinibacteria bacterium]
MKISLRWLSDRILWNKGCDPWKNPDAASRIADRLTQSTAEVEHIEESGALLKNVCVGQILTIKKHPNADKLSLCQVKTDKGIKKIVCGGTNLREGMYSACAHIGARVRWHGEELMTLTKTSIRGEESEGMLCTAEELDLQEQFPESTGRNILDLDGRKPTIGQSLKELLGLDDIVFHIDNHAITHRPDLFSHIGFARECVALGLAQWRKTTKKPPLKFPKSPAPFRLFVQEKNLMPRYCACVIEIDNLGLTPDWMKRRLEAVGWRPVNLPVDITNFVASEIGVPLHSFDLDDLDGDIHMRKSQKDERIITLDKKEFLLPEGALVLEDRIGIFDLLGIMGGLRSSTKDSTRRIYLHAASLDPVSIRRTVISTGHRTDAATVYEKGVPHITTEIGFFRAVELFLKLVPGARLTSRLEGIGNNGHSKPIKLSHMQLQHVLGFSITPKEIIRIFTDLGFDIKKKSKNYIVNPPLWRLRDCSIPHDLMEEIARIHGYHRIAHTIPESSILPPHRDHRKTNVRLTLRECGFTEIVPSPFVSSAVLQKCRLDPRDALFIENPFGSDTSLLQPNTIPSLLVHAEKNVLHAEDALRTFTIAHVFHKDGTEHEELGLLYIPKKESRLADHPLLAVSSVVSHLLTKIGYPSEVHPAPPSPMAHSARSGSIHVGGIPIGIISQLHPAICSAFDLPSLSTSGQIDLTNLSGLLPVTPFSSSLPEFPAIVYDITIPWNHQKSSSTLLKRLTSASPLLEQVNVHDLFAQNPNDASYNLTIRCTYRSPERTLTECEVQREHERLTLLAHTV